MLIPEYCLCISMKRYRLPIHLNIFTHIHTHMHPLYCEKEISIRYGAHKPVRVSCSHCHAVDVMNDIILFSYAGFVMNVCLLDRCGKCTYMAINTFWIWIWILIDRTFSTYRTNFSSNHPRNTPHRSPSWASYGCRSWVQSLIQVLRL